MFRMPAHLALGLAMACAVAVAPAATLHRPLPADSLARNGTPQPIQHGHDKFAPPPPPLRDTGPLANAAAGLKRPYGGTPIDALTYHYDLNRTGWNQSETDLTPATVGSGKFGLLTTLAVDGLVLAQPLLVSHFTMPDGSTHDVLVVATEHNSIYAFDARTYAALWHVNLGPSQSSKDLSCLVVQPEYGISGTPVIVRSGAAAATIYLVAATEPVRYSFHTQVHALDLGTGADLTTPTEIAPSAKLRGGGTISFDPQNEWNRAGLAYANGNVYVAISSHGDHAPDSISGWLLNYDSADLTLLHHFHTIETAGDPELASIWMSGFAPAIDSKGNVFAVTGNGAFGHGEGNWGESVIELPPDLGRVEDSFTPATWHEQNSTDTDFGSAGVMLLPKTEEQTAPPMAVALGKSRVLYLLNQNRLGRMTTGDKGALQRQVLKLVHAGGLWGGPAYYGGPGGGLVYVQIDGDVLRGFGVTTGSSPALTLAAQGTSAAGPGGSLPIVSSNGAQPGTGVVWLARRGTTVQLEAYDAVALGNPLFAANAGAWSNKTGNAFVTPLEANGRVYVGSFKTVTVFGLAP